ncbi:unnamed protein product [Spirodela intermedia]|uniref:Uncharacterized protein n=1 Tax=Spirodela intermedia TaxID=51605 RepID=A0A7I8JAD3_SPIIN|nr:unnamed protein product [Spirodela intermedia]CAA6666393.1 unnamed protein product [Spirodela intermedia]
MLQAARPRAEDAVAGHRPPAAGGRPPRLPDFPAAVSTTGEKQCLDWAEATAGFFRDDSRPIMLFDGVCNMCNGGVRFVRGNDPNRRIRFEALQSEAGKMLLQRSGRAPNDISSVVLVEKDRSYIKSEAVLRIMEYLRLPFPKKKNTAIDMHIFSLPRRFVRDFAYDNVANNRYAFFGRSDSCEL